MYNVQVLVSELIEAYPSLELISQDENELIVSGIIRINRCIDQFTVLKNWQIEIHIPTIPDSLPYVVDVENYIDINYPHRYKDGKICLATDFDQMLLFSESYSLSLWMERYVEPYLVIHDYYQRYSIFPNGDREHGSIGMLQAYQDYFDTDFIASLRLLSYISQHVYRGHVPCPCGTDKKLRNCHGKKLQKIYNSPILLKQVRADFQYIRRDYSECNSRQAKKL